MLNIWPGITTKVEQEAVLVKCYAIRKNSSLQGRAIYLRFCARLAVSLRVEVVLLKRTKIADKQLCTYS